MKMTRRKLFLYLLAALVIVFRRRLIKVIRFVRELYHGGQLMRALPGPGKESEGALFGHMTGPLMCEPGMGLTPEYIVEHIVDHLMSVSKLYKNEGLFRLYALNSSIPCNILGVIVPHRIDVVREILSHKSMEDFNKGVAYKISHPLIGDSVLSTSREAWAPQRPIVERGFSHDIVGRSVPKIVQTANELADKWERAARASRNSAEHDVRESMLRLTMDVIGRAAFGFDFNSTTSDVAPLYDPFVVIMYTLERRMNLPHEYFLRNVPFIERNRKFDQAMAKLNGLVDDILIKREAESADSAGNRQQDFLDMLLKNGDMSPRAIKDNIKTLLFAGHDTTGAALAWFLHLLSSHPEAQKRVRAEVLEKFGPRGDPTYEELEELSFLNACFLETLRLYPSAGFMRRPRHHVKIAGYDIPAYAEILLLPYLLHRDEQYWERANDFIPERFLELGFETSVQEGSKVHARMDSLQSRIGRISKEKAYFPFSLGPRNCVGRPLALAEMRVVAIKLLQRFSFRLTEDKEFAPTPLLTLTLNPKSIRLVPVLMEDGA